MTILILALITLETIDLVFPLTLLTNQDFLTAINNEIATAVINTLFKITKRLIVLLTKNTKVITMEHNGDFT